MSQAQGRDAFVHGFTLRAYEVQPRPRILLDLSAWYQMHPNPAQGNLVPRQVCRVAALNQILYGRAGIHRGLGVHISKVRSCTLDTWLPEQVAFMARTGNAKANAHFEARLEPTQKPSYYSPELESFIRRKVSGFLQRSAVHCGS